MSRRRGVPQKRSTVRIRTLQLLVLMGSVILAQGQTASPLSAQANYKTSNRSANPPEPPGEKAWRNLYERLKDTNSEKRAKAARAPGLADREHPGGKSGGPRA